MEKIKDNVIVLKTQLGDPKGIFIPKGIKENVTITIVDGFATFKFDHSNICQKFAQFAIKHQTPSSPEQTQYNERTQKSITKYKGKTKEEILVILKDQLNKMSLNVK